MGRKTLSRQEETLNISSTASWEGAGALTLGRTGFASQGHCVWSVCLWELIISFNGWEPWRLWEHCLSARKSTVRSHGDNKGKSWNAPYPSTGVPGRCLQHSAERQRGTRRELKRLTVDEHRICHSCWLCIKILNKQNTSPLRVLNSFLTLLEEGPWICRIAAEYYLISCVTFSKLVKSSLLLLKQESCRWLIY